MEKCDKLKLFRRRCTTIPKESASKIGSASMISKKSVKDCIRVFDMIIQRLNVGEMEGREEQYLQTGTVIMFFSDLKKIHYY